VADHTKATTDKDNLVTLLTHLTKATKTLIDAVAARDALQAISALQTRQRGLQEVVLRLVGVVDERYPDMVKLATSLADLKKKLANLEGLRQTQKVLDVYYVPGEAVTALQTLLALKPRIKELNEYKTTITLTIGEYEDICSQIEVIEAGIATTTKAIGETCPTCGKPLK
jgi:DNA repair exonuclease SbcCD ATPase subunit